MSSLAPALEALLARLSLEELETLLLLARAPERAWSATAVAGELLIGIQSAAIVLENLTRMNLLDVRLGSDVVYRFAPVHAADATLVRELGSAYETKRLLVLKALRSGTDPAHAFADAFRIKRRLRG